MKKLVFLIAFVTLSSYTYAQKKVIKTESQVESSNPDIQGLKRKVAIARFSNETQYAKGVFYDKANDPLGKQALDILSTKLSSSNKFILLERSDLDKIEQELKIAGTSSPQNVGADYLIIGSITEYGRKNVGDVGVFSRSKIQTVQAGVSIRLVDVSNGQIIYSEEAKGEAETTTKTVMGLGKEADFDATLSDKAISAAISKLVENIINNCLDRPWKSYFLSYDENGIIVSGGKSQGVKIGDVYDVVSKGKSVKNPQNGLLIELPGKTVGKVQVDFVGGENPQNEFSIVSFTSGEINKQNLESYYIKEIKK